ncbi:MAG: ankyrin repeat domain-containing protein [Bryobacteraceae bacterium]
MKTKFAGYALLLFPLTLSAAKLDQNLDPALVSAVERHDLKQAEALLSRGADPNAKTPEGSSVLAVAALNGDEDTVRMLIRRGANVNAASPTGRTPLLIAASVDGSYKTVKLLLDKGAAVNAKDKTEGMPLVPVGGGGETPLMNAAKNKDSRSLQLLLERGADVNAKDHTGGTALTAAALFGNAPAVKLLLEHGAEVNTAMRSGMTPLSMAAIRNDAEIVKMLLAKGADRNATDGSGSTPLMWAAYSETGKTAVLETLLQAGVEVNAKNKMGETALTWARRNGETAIVSRLRAAGAVDSAPASVASPAYHERKLRPAVEAGLEVLQRSGPQFVKKSGCVSCHHQASAAMAIGMARDLGFQFNEQLAVQQQKAVIAMFKPARTILLEASDVVPDMPLTGGYSLLGLAAEKYAADGATDAMVRNIAAKQNTDGNWTGWSPRPPIEYGDIRSTVVALRALQLYAPEGRRSEYDSRIARAGKWLSREQPNTTEERIMQLLGLAWAKARATDVANVADRLLAEQREDGGWAQLATLDSDAYATGKAVFALREAKVISISDEAYRRGVRYLLRTQTEDGSWLVKTRVFPFQPLIDTGFPHGRNQWISAAGTRWAVMALMLAEEPAHTAGLR